MLESSKQKKNSGVIKIIAIITLVVIGGIVGYCLMNKKNNEPSLTLGEQQRRQTNNAVLQLANNLLDNADNLNQLTKKPNGTAKTIQEIEEDFLISAFYNSSQPSGINIGQALSPEVIERIWWELKPWIEEYLQDLNRSILEHAREKCRRDVENWLKWQQKEHNQQLEEYWKRFQELKRIEDLIAEYQTIREEELLEKISRKTELWNKGYVDRDIEKLKEWNLITPNQEIPDLNAEKRIGATNILWTQGDRIGGSSDLVIFLKPKTERIPQVKESQNNSETIINFSTQIAYEDKEGYKQFVRDYLTEKGKFDYDAYCLIRTDSSMSGPSAGIAYYLALYSLINQVPLPRNLGSTGTVFERPKVGGIGGLNLKLGYNVGHDIKKENPINIFILCEENRNKEVCAKLNNGLCYKENAGSYYDLVSSQIKEKIKQVHFISHTDQIESALEEILKEPNRKIVHSCNREEKPQEPREPPINTEITPEKLLSLIVEYYSREEITKERYDFRNKLFASCMNSNNWKIIEEALQLRNETLRRLEMLGTDQEKKTCQKCRQEFSEGFMVNNKGEGEEFFCSNCIGKAEGWIKPWRKGMKQNERNEEEKKQIYQEYENQFLQLTSSASDLTSKILNNLANYGYIIQEIRWVGELHVPSLTDEPSVNASITKR